MWFCPPCKVKVEKTIVVERSIELRCQEHYSKIEAKLVEMRIEIDKKCNTDDVKEMIKQQIVNSGNQGNTQTGQVEGAVNVMDNTMKEMNDRRAEQEKII